MSIAGSGTGVAIGGVVGGPLGGVVGGVVGSILGPHSGKTTHVQRFVAAQAAGDIATAETLVDQAYSHAYLENIPDRADWVAVYQQMLQMANPTLRAYMNTKSGAGKTGTNAAGAASAPPAVTVASTTTGGVSLVWLGVILLVAGAGVYFFLKRRR